VGVPFVQEYKRAGLLNVWVSFAVAANAPNEVKPFPPFMDWVGSMDAIVVSSPVNNPQSRVPVVVRFMPLPQNLWVNFGG
jgi:hypothetical protein